MFLGHFGVAMAAKKIEPRLNLGVAVLGAQLVDLVWPLFLVMGIERVEIKPGHMAMNHLDFVHYPWTHSLAASIDWAVVAGAVMWMVTKDKKKSLVMAGLVLSHWFLDLLYHSPDLLLLPGGDTRVGLGLWNSPFATWAGELLLFAGGIYLFLTSREKLTGKAAISFWSLVVFLLVMYAGSVFGPPPPSAMAIGFGGLTMWLFVPWARWADPPAKG